VVEMRQRNMLPMEVEAASCWSAPLGAKKAEVQEGEEEQAMSPRCQLPDSVYEVRPSQQPATEVQNSLVNPATSAHGEPTSSHVQTKENESLTCRGIVACVDCHRA